MSGINVGSINSLSTTIREAQGILHTIKAQRDADIALREAQARQEREIAIQREIQKGILERQKYLEDKVTAVRPKLQEIILSAANVGENNAALFELPVTYGAASVRCPDAYCALASADTDFYIGDGLRGQRFTGAQILSKFSSESPVFSAFLKELTDAGCKVYIESGWSRFGNCSAFGECIGRMNYENMKKAKAYLVFKFPIS